VDSFQVARDTAGAFPDASAWAVAADKTGEEVSCGGLDQNDPPLSGNSLFLQ